MLRIHNGLRKWIKINLFDLHLLKINQFYSRVPCIKIARIELLFQLYIMDINWEKCEIWVLNDDEIKRN